MTAEEQSHIIAKLSYLAGLTNKPDHPAIKLPPVSLYIEILNTRLNELLEEVKSWPTV